MPDKWWSVAEKRSFEYKLRVFHNLRVKKYFSDECGECPMLRRVFYIESYTEWVFTSCLLYSDKCIRQYPHISDSKEFT